MIQSLTYDVNNGDKNVILQDVLKTEKNSDTGFILEVELKHTDEIKQKRPYFFHFVPRIN